MSESTIDDAPQRRGWLWRLLFGEETDFEFAARWQRRLDEERAQRLKPGYRGGDVIALPLTGDVINTKKIYAIQIDLQKVIIHLENFQRVEILCDTHADAQTIRDNIARVMDIREGPTY